MSSKPTLGYWDIRGIAQPIRNLLVYSGVDFNDKLYPFGPGTSLAEAETACQHWYKEKFSLGLDFPNLPYLVDGQLKLTQSTAILKYLARKHGLIAKDIVTLAKQEMLEQQLHDAKQGLIGLAYADNYEDQKDNYEKVTLPSQLKPLDTYLGANEWFTGAFSYVDILAYEVLDWQRLYSPNTFASYSNLVKFMQRFENLPKIKQYFETSQYKNWQLFSPMAHWGYGNLCK